MKVSWSYFLTRWYTKRKRYIMNVNEAVIIARIMTFRYYVTWEKQCSHKSWHYDGSYHDVVVQENLPLLLAICRQSHINPYLQRYNKIPEREWYHRLSFVQKWTFYLGTLRSSTWKAALRQNHLKRVVYNYTPNSTQTS